ncbi:DUF2281 domain-containing protein [Psychroflexus tropicus]|uniref:DUF2281 domain-containing protein n=1 Tax=Psychroflexus tropicus TaxID=197345 RepID=UPI0003797F27|nr:DUF2281 domain-containing protein [Psychroflexus tropicus]
MKKEELIDKAVEKINRLPNNKIQEVSDFIDFLLAKIDNQVMVDNAQRLSSESSSFDFLEEEENLYSISDLKEYYK